ncbi:hypothetical protein GIB67_020090 [Kingdonia uniflora]|uniref:Pentatricopeptide repeat-containing protein n=1 Tax=Kingdonia uniflora TaxID=39325 RepID=A0A7J7L2I8_9MAGN|nr:hypothetical protein GIB67_020090 [Kingdonia uniflora]
MQVFSSKIPLLIYIKHLNFICRTFHQTFDHQSSKQHNFTSNLELASPQITKESTPDKNDQTPDTISKGPPRFVCLEKKPNFSNTQSQHCSDEYSADVEKVYRILRKFHSRVPKLDLALKESDIVVSSVLVERVLSRCGDAGNMGYRFYDWASKQPGYRPSYEVYKSMIKILSKMRQFGAVWALIEEMRKENPQLLTADAFVVLIRRFASARMVQKAIEVLDEMPKYGCEPDEYVFGCLLDALCKNGNVKEAASLFEDMRIRFTPNLKHFTSLLYGWCKLGKLMEAKFVLVQMREAGFAPDIVAYNNLLSGYTIAGKIQDGFHLLQEMKRVECNPNATSYTIMIQALCARERMDEAMLVFVEMGKNRCVADVVTYTTLISGFCKWGKINKAYELLDNMIQQGCTPGLMTYFHILAALEKKEKMEECLELVEEMQKIGCFPDLHIYNIVIRLACKLGDVEEAVRVWNRIEASELSPGLDTYTVMIHGFLAQGCLTEACGYFKEMVERGLFSTPQYGTLKEILNPLLRAEKLEMAKDVWSCILSKGCDLNVSAWTIWIHALFLKGHVKEACYYCINMLDAGIMPQPNTFAKLMQGLKKLYNRAIAAEITDRVRQMAADRNITFKMYKRRGVRDLRDKVKPKEDGRGVWKPKDKVKSKKGGKRSNRRQGGQSRNRAKTV